MAHSWSFGSAIPSDSRLDEGADPAALAPGQRFGPFVVEGDLGAGSTSRVYRARTPEGDRVALKVLRAGVDPALRERFAREGRLAAAIRHPGIVALHSGGEVAGVPFLAYELVEGARPLQAALAAAGLAGRCRLLVAAAAAVAHAHAAGIVHRDLKPQNLLVDAAGRVRVADFGLGFDREGPRLTQSGEALGTPLYMAPEQAEGRHPLGPAVDVWALGVLLYEALSGRLPFRSEGWLELRAELRSASPTPLGRLNPDVPPGLEAVGLTALAREPARRYPDAGAFGRALEAALGRARLPDEPTAAPPLSGRSAGSSRHGPFPLGPRGRFELLEVLGRGGMGVVYRARDPELGREVALKFILGVRGNQTRLERFRREGEVTASLHHPGILGVHSTGVLEGIPYIVYELVPGARTLGEALRRTDRRSGVALVRDAARALGYAHRRGVTHRDVKPENCLLDREGRLQVADFGLAAAQGADRLTRSGAVLGTPGFMAPELMTGERERVGPPTDVWALGVILFQALTGRLPFEDAGGYVELARRVTSERCPSPRRFAPDVDRRIEAVCRRCLEIDPDRRFRDGEVLAADLDAWLEDRPLVSTETSAWLPRAVRGVGWRQALPVAAALVGVGVAVPLALQATSGPEAPAGGDASRSAPGTPTPEPTAAPSPEETGAEAAWDAVLETPDRTGRLRAAEAWLEAHPAHPGARAARELVAGLRFAAPLATLEHAASGKAGAVFRGDEELVTFGANHLLRWMRTADAWAPGDRIDVDVRGNLDALVVAPGERYVFSWGVGLGCRPPWPGAAPGGEPIQVECLALSPDGRAVAVGRELGGTELRAAADGRLLRRFPADAAVQALAFDPEGARLVVVSAETEGVGSERRAVACWSLAPGAGEEPLFARRPRLLPRAVAWTEAGDRIVAGSSSGHLLFLDAATGEPVGRLEGPERSGEVGLIDRNALLGSVRGLALLADGRALAVSKGDTPGFNQIGVWDPATGGLRGFVAERPPQQLGLALSPDERYAAVGTSRGVVEVWVVPPP